MNDTVKLLIAVAAGAAAGAILGILFAPAKGEETRDTIVKKGKDVADEIARKFKHVKEDARQQSEVFS